MVKAVTSEELLLLLMVPKFSFVFLACLSSLFLKKKIQKPKSKQKGGGCSSVGRAFA